MNGEMSEAKICMQMIKTFNKQASRSLEMKTPSLTEAIEWVALNDDIYSDDPKEVKGIVSIALVADLFGKTSLEIAKKVIKFKKENK